MRLLLALLLLALFGCGDDDPGGADGAVHCRTDSDCDDTVFCNGTERCDPADPLASPSAAWPARPA